MKILVIMFLIFSLSACGSTKKTNKSATFKNKQGKVVELKVGPKPDWVDGKASQYPAALFVTAVGVGADRDKAEDDARAEMSKVFYSKIESVDTSLTNFNVLKKDGKIKSTDMEYTKDSYSKISTDAVFKGMFLSEYWQDADGKVFVLATIKRSQVIPALEEAVADLDKNIKQMVSESETTEDRVVKAKKIYKAIDKAILREYYNSQLAVLNHNGETIPTEYSVDTLTNMIDNQLEDLNIAVVISGEGGKNIKNIILEVGTNLDLKVYGDESVDSSAGSFESFEDDENATKKETYATDADILIIGEVSFKALNRGDPKYEWVEGTVSLQIKNSKTGKTYKNINISEREGRKTLQEAKRMVGKTIVKTLKTKLQTELKKALSGA